MTGYKHNVLPQRNNTIIGGFSASRALGRIAAKPNTVLLIFSVIKP
jgi:hypothetical protein